MQIGYWWEPIPDSLLTHFTEFSILPEIHKLKNKLALLNRIRQIFEGDVVRGQTNFTRKSLS